MGRDTSLDEPGIPIVSSADDWDGEPRIRVAATQRDDLTARQATRLVAGWIEFFGAGPSTIRDLEFVTRTPKRLFDSLASQTQLERLAVKWGDYEDLTVLGGMTRLRELFLRGASSVRSILPLSLLTGVRKLALEGLLRTSDLTPIARMNSVVDLELGGDWMAPRNAHIDSIRFLEEMPQLTDLLIHTTIVDDKDYSPLLRLPSLQRVRVMKTRGMRPTHDELRATLPWSN